MKIVSYNINGIRASVKLGLDKWIKEYAADIYCFQEVRASEKIARECLLKDRMQLSLFNDEINELEEYTSIFNCGEIAGYAGTLILSRVKPDNIFYDMGNIWSDKEGRTTTIIIDNIAIVNAYIPNGNSRLEFKMQYLQALKEYINKLKQKYSVICMGDFNIAHNEIDLTNPKECKNKSVFLPIEREAFSDFLSIGLVDTFRYLNKDEVKYSWRSYRSRYDDSYNSWKYRIDYIIVSDDLKKKLKSSDILDLDYSDHLPCVLEVNFK